MYMCLNMHMYVYLCTWLYTLYIHVTLHHAHAQMLKSIRKHTNVVRSIEPRTYRCPQVSLQYRLNRDKVGMLYKEFNVPPQQEERQTNDDSNSYPLPEFSEPFLMSILTD